MDGLSSVVRTAMENGSASRTQAGSPRFEVLNPLDLPDWDSEVAAHPEATFFHSSAWARVLAESYGYAPVYFTARQGESLCALLPVMEVDSVLTGRRGVSLPFTDECAPLISAEVSGEALLGRAIQHGRSRGWRYIECRSGGNVPGAASAPACFYGHWLELDPDENRMLTCFDGAVRRAIKRAENAGLRVELSRELKAVELYYGLHCRTRSRQGLPPQPRSFFLKLFEHAISKEMGFVAVAWQGQRPAAGAVFLHLGGRAVFKYGASVQTLQHLRANNLVMWEAIRWMAHHRISVLHFGRTSVFNEGLRRFKRGWGASEREIRYFKYDLRRERFAAVKDRTSGWHSRVFKAMPAFIARAIGQVFYRHWG
jgi:lipid II:glycine glycyltransferase (peptidoglycan interpeptide bridge formation enzyme)